MRLAEARRRIASSRPALASAGVKDLHIFGSVARGDARPDSDIDVLVELAGPTTFDAYMEIKETLEACLGVPVDLVTLKALRPEIRDRILAEAVRAT